MPEVVIQHKPVLVTVRGRIKKPFSSEEDEFDDVLVTYWHSQISQEPHLYLIALPIGGKERELIEQSGAFVVHFIGGDWGEKIKLIENHTPLAERIKKANLTVQEAQNVDAYRIDGVDGFFECKVERMEEIGESVAIIGRVLRSRLDLTPQS